jgi:hypothetical protein
MENGEEGQEPGRRGCSRKITTHDKRKSVDASTKKINIYIVLVFEEWTQNERIASNEIARGRKQRGRAH